MVTSRPVLARIESLQIPPAYKRVWISEDKRDHIQAIAYDENNKAQYTYHPDWIEARKKTKYNRILEFGEALPDLRARVASDLKLKGFAKSKVLAVAVRILETTQIRIGSREYLSQNGTYGLTTLTKKKAILTGTSLQFNFRGKHDKKNENLYELDSKFAAVLESMYDSPGVRWLRYQDENGRWKDLTPSDVNEYIHEISGGNFTAKDFRTWHGTVLAADFLFRLGKPLDEDPQDHIDDAIEYVATRLVNTGSVSRESYIFPGIFEAFEDWLPFKIAFEAGQNQVERRRTGRSPVEEAVLLLLRQN